MSKILKYWIGYFLFILLLSGCYTDNSSVDKKQSRDLSKAFIVINKNFINLEINTKNSSLTNSVQVIVLTNIGKQPATHLKFDGFSVTNISLLQANTCNASLASGASCEVKISLTINHKTSAAGPISGITNMLYEYDNGQEKIIEKFPIRFKLEKWIGSVFLTEQSTTGNILYQFPLDYIQINRGVDSADLYCKADKNNPHNGYDYRALIYDTTSRTPYLEWVLMGGATYFSVMPGVYHQKVWQTAYEQGRALSLFAQLYNCIGVNCLLHQETKDSEAWTGFELTNNNLNARTCGTTGSSWRSAANNAYGKSFAIGWGRANNSMVGDSLDSSCFEPKKIICVSQ